MTDVERLAIDYAAKASVYRESAEAYSTSKSGEMRIAADAHKSLADDCAIIAAALRDAAEREKGCDHCNMTHIDSPNDYDNQAIITGTGWTHLCFGVDENGRLYLRAVGDAETDRWYPKHCPWCGRDLTGGKG